MDQSKRGNYVQRLTIMATVLVLAPCVNASAQALSTRRPVFLVALEAQYGALHRSAAGASLFIPVRRWTCAEMGCGAHSVEVHALAGRGGWRIGAGHAAMGFPLGFPFWSDALVTVTHTGTEPRGASQDATYVGVEAGTAFPAYMKGNTVLSIRPSIGVARRVAGAGVSSDRTTFTWNVGAYFVIPKLRRPSGG